jgi:hypothetical protein
MVRDKEDRIVMFIRKVICSSGATIESAVSAFNEQTLSLQRSGEVNFIYAVKISVGQISNSSIQYSNGQAIAVPSSYQVFHVYQEIEYQPYDQSSSV